MKKCSKCLKTKNIQEFSVYLPSSNGYRLQCKSCRALYTKQYRQANKEKVRLSNKRYRNENVEKTNAYSDKWRKNNPQKNAARTARRHAAKVQRTPKWLTQQHFIQIELFYEAAAKLTKEFGIKIEVDHIVPLRGHNVSGLHVPWNLQVLPKEENVKKGNRL